MFIFQLSVVFAAALNSINIVYGAFTTPNYFSDTYSSAPEGAFRTAVLLICIIAVLAVMVEAWSSNRLLSNFDQIKSVICCANIFNSSTVFPASTLPCTSIVPV